MKKKKEKRVGKIRVSKMIMIMKQKVRKIAMTKVKEKRSKL